jgi:hypothetical protein
MKKVAVTIFSVSILFTSVAFAAGTLRQIVRKEVPAPILKNENLDAYILSLSEMPKGFVRGGKLQPNPGPVPQAELAHTLKELGLSSTPIEAAYSAVYLGSKPGRSYVWFVAVKFPSKQEAQKAYIAFQKSRQAEPHALKSGAVITYWSTDAGEEEKHVANKYIELKLLKKLPGK